MRARPVLVTFCALSVVLMIGVPLTGQTATSTMGGADILAAANTRLCGSTYIRDVSISARALSESQLASGSATLAMRATGETRLTLDLADSRGEEVTARDAPGTWRNGSGETGDIPLHNSFVRAYWLVPTLAIQSELRDPEMRAAYLGAELWHGARVNHVQLWREPGGQKSSALSTIRRLSTVDVLLDATTQVPLAVLYMTHPNNDASTDIPVEISFADYRSVDGVQIPFEINKRMNGSLVFGLRLTGATVNPALADSVFALQ